MGKKYSQEEMKRILRQDIGTSDITEQKIQEAYARIRSTGSLPAQARRKPVFKKWMVLAAAVGLLGVSSATVLGGNGFFSHRTLQEEGSLKYTFEVNYELTTHEVEIVPGYIPEGYEQFEDGSLKYDKEGYLQNGISIFVANAAHLEAGETFLDVDNVKSMEETTINGMESQLITINYDPERVTRLFDKRIYMFNEEEGYVGIVFGGNDLTMGELVKVAEGITFTVTDEEVEYVSTEDKEVEEASARAWEEEQKAIEAYGVPQEYIHQIGETLNWMLENAQADYAALESDEEYRAAFGGAKELMANYADTKGVEVTVTGAEVLDSIAGFPTEGFFQYDDLANCFNEDGTAKAYTRVTYEEMPVKVGDGTGEISREEVTPKFVKVTLSATNLEDETIDYWAGEAMLDWLEAAEDGHYRYVKTYSEPLNRQEYSLSLDDSAIYFDQSPYAGELNGHFFFRDLEPGETLEYTLLFAVDEDRLDNLYLRFGSAHGVADLAHDIYYQRYVDISQ